MTTLLALALAFSALVLAARLSRSGGKGLWLALFVLAVGTGSINPLIEAVVFGVMPLSHVPASVASYAALSAVTAAGAIAAARRWTGVAAAATRQAPRATRLAATTLVYVVLYLAAGMAVFPFVKDFYATKTLPSLTTLAGLQIFRGLLYAFFAWPWLCTRPRAPGLGLAILFAMLGGVAPLLADDNPYMPERIRHAHLVEVGISNALFGFAAARLLLPAERKSAVR